jgi:hypothetical protein
VRKNKKRAMDDKVAMKVGIMEHKRKDPAHFNEVYLPSGEEGGGWRRSNSCWCLYFPSSHFLLVLQTTL